MIENAPTSPRLQTFQSRALALATNTFPAQRSILESYRAMYATFLVILDVGIMIEVPGITIKPYQKRLKVKSIEKYNRLQHLIYSSCIRQGNIIQIEYHSPRTFPINEASETNLNQIEKVYLNFTHS